MVALLALLPDRAFAGLVELFALGGRHHGAARGAAHIIGLAVKAFIVVVIVAIIVIALLIYLVRRLFRGRRDRDRPAY